MATSPTAATRPPSLSTSDDEHELNQDGLEIEEDVDPKKKKRKQSNRESARRSRQRKLQHTQELNQEIAHLKSLNTQMEGKLSNVKSTFSTISSENNGLRRAAGILTRRLEELEEVHKAKTQLPDGTQSNRFAPGQVDPFAKGHFAPYSQMR